MYRALIACEFSGIVRDAIRARPGWEALSCDLLPSEKPGPHWEGDVQQLLLNAPNHYDLMVAHPPCTHLAVSGARWFKDKVEEQKEALAFVQMLMNADVPHIALENPISVISSKIRKPDQIVQPWMFGHGETKATCWWLKNLPKLEPTDVVEGREGRVWKMSPSENRWKERSRTFPGLAQAIADQWCSHVEKNYETKSEESSESQDHTV